MYCVTVATVQNVTSQLRNQRRGVLLTSMFAFTQLNASKNDAGPLSDLVLSAEHFLLCAESYYVNLCRSKCKVIYPGTFFFFA